MNSSLLHFSFLTEFCQKRLVSKICGIKCCKSNILHIMPSLNKYIDLRTWVTCHRKLASMCQLYCTMAGTMERALLTLSFFWEGKVQDCSMSLSCPDDGLNLMPKTQPLCKVWPPVQVLMLHLCLVVSSVNQNRICTLRRWSMHPTPTQTLLYIKLTWMLGFCHFIPFYRNEFLFSNILLYENIAGLLICWQIWNTSPKAIAIADFIVFKSTLQSSLWIQHWFFILLTLIQVAS